MPSKWKKIMDELKKILKREWEMVALGVALLLAAVLLVVALSYRSTDGWTFGRGAVAVNRPTKLKGSAFAFLRKYGVDTTIDRNPFSSGLSIPEPPKPVVVKKPEPIVAPPPEPPKEEVVEQPAVEEVVEEPKPAAPQGPQKVVGLANYSFMNVNNSGKTVAVFSIQTSKTDTENYALGVGESGGGVKVLAITNDALLLLDASNRRWKIPKGKPCRMMVVKE